MKLVVANDLEDLGRLAAKEFLRIVDNEIRRTGKCSVALSGGSTPIAMYRRLIASGLAEKHTAYFFGDERNVPPDDPQSNFRTANENFFKPAGISSEKIFRWKTELSDPENIADDYSKILKQEFGDAAIPRFSLIILGIGTDGHTASLFPETAALSETKNITVANWVEKLNTWRFTLTLPVINNADNVMFLASGKDKAEILRAVIEGNDGEASHFPSRAVQPASGNLEWIVDRDAAELLERSHGV